MSIKKTHEQFLIDLEKVTDEITVLGTYVNSNTPILCKCNRCNHKWKPRPSDLLRGKGCPCCAGHILVPGVNDLESNYPDIAKQWHPTKNGSLTPSQVFKMSNKPAWWICEKGHDWEVQIGSRTRQDSGCPYCANKKVWSGFNDLQTLNPSVAADWDYDKNESTPDKVLAGSHSKVYWKCQFCSKKWNTRIVDRTNGSGCPKCKEEYHSSFPERIISFYLKQKFEVLQNYKISGMEVDVYLPEYKIAIEYDGKYYHDSERCRKREEEKRICLKTEGIQLINVKEAKENRIDGNIIWCNYHRSYNFASEMIENILTVIAETTNILVTIPVDIRKDYSEILAQFIKARKEKSLATVYPELVPFWDKKANGGLLVEQISYGSDRYYNWKCKKNHTWSERIANLVRGDRCPYCSGHRASEENNLLVKFPEIAKQWHPTKNGDLKPSEFLPKSNEEVYWMCPDCGKTYKLSIDKRTGRNQGCSKCGKRRMVETQIRDKIAKKGSLLDNYPEIAKQWHPTENGTMRPSDVLSGSNFEAWWMCPECGHVHPKKVRHKVYHSRCPMCKK